jgi:hypothetical protein
MCFSQVHFIRIFLEVKNEQAQEAAWLSCWQFRRHLRQIRLDVFVFTRGKILWDECVRSCSRDVDRHWTSTTETFPTIAYRNLRPATESISRSQWPRRLRHELSSPVQTLGSLVRIPLEAWVSMCVNSVFVLSCVQVAALRRTDPPSKESYWLCKRSREWKSGQGPTKGCRAIDR